MSHGRSAGTVLLLGNYRPALTLARTMKSRGYRVIAGSLGCEGGCENSRAVGRMWDHPDPSENPEQFNAQLRAFCSREADLVAIYPVSEEMVRFFASPRHPSDLPVPVAMVTPATVTRCFDKLGLLELARANQVGAAPFARASGWDELEEALGAIGYPVVIRPLNSDRRIKRKKALTLASAEDLNTWKPHLLEHPDLLVQRHFTGVRHNVYFAAVHGQISRCLHAKILRTDRLDGSGLALEGVTLPASGPLISQTAQLVSALGYHGIGCAQFLVDPKSGQSSFLEINPRIAGNHALPEAAGLELGSFQLDLSLGQHVDTALRLAPAGTRYCWTSGDLLAAKESFMRREIGIQATLRWILHALVTAVRCPVHIVFDWRDPMPAVHALVDILPRLNRGRPRRDQVIGQLGVPESRGQ